VPFNLFNEINELENRQCPRDVGIYRQKSPCRENIEANQGDVLSVSADSSAGRAHSLAGFSAQAVLEALLSGVFLPLRP
jgi:hypothetical protein